MRLESLHIGSNWDSFYDFIEKRKSGIETGIPRLDVALMGLRGIVSIVGEPGACKSTLALQFALHHATVYGSVIIYDRENGFNRLRLRSLCNLGRTYERKIYEEGVPEEILVKLKELPLYICHDETPNQLDILIKELREKDNKPIMLVVDSIQALPSLAEDKRYSVSRWVETLDHFKLEHEGNLSIVATSEKNRQNYKGPALGSPKESGSIEYKSEQLLDLVYNEKTDLIALWIEKNRDGLKNYRLMLEKELVEPNNPHSFCFRLNPAFRLDDDKDPI